MSKPIDYEAIVKGYADGTINHDEWMLIFDNDGGYWSWEGPPPEGIDADSDAYEDLRTKKSDEMEEKYGCPNGYADLVELARAAGINADWC